MGNKITSSKTSTYYTPISPQLPEVEDVKKPHMIGTLCKLPATKLRPNKKNSHRQVIQSKTYHSVAFKGANRSCSDTGYLLQQVSSKLEVVERERYIMQQKARIEQCKRGANLNDLDSVKWYHFSNCQKKYV